MVLHGRWTYSFWGPTLADKTMKLADQQARIDLADEILAPLGQGAEKIRFGLLDGLEMLHDMFRDDVPMHLVDGILEDLRLQANYQELFVAYVDRLTIEKGEHRLSRRILGKGRTFEEVNAALSELETVPAGELRITYQYALE